MSATAGVSSGGERDDARRRDAGNHQRVSVAAERVLQEACELGVAVRYVSCRGEGDALAAKPVKWRTGEDRK